MDLKKFDKILLSISGGKDSQAMLTLITAQAAAQGVHDRLMAIHIDTGGEWPESQPHCKYLSGIFQIPLKIITPTRTIAEEVIRRGAWPSALCRFCTSYAKRDPYEKFIRSLSSQKILHITGERKEESRHRSKLEEIANEERVHTKLRCVTRWRPMLKYNQSDIWAIIRESKLASHAAYDYGCDRVSCSLCVLAPQKDLIIGAKHNREQAENYLKIEKDIGSNFRHVKSLSEILGKIS